MNMAAQLVGWHGCLTGKMMCQSAFLRKCGLTSYRAGCQPGNQPSAIFGKAVRVVAMLVVYNWSIDGPVGVFTLSIFEFGCEAFQNKH